MAGPIEDLLKSDEFAENGWVRVVGFRWEGWRLECELRIDEGAEGRTLSVWKVSCDEVRDYLIVDVNGGGLNINDGDHPAARQHSDPVVDLSIRDAVADPARLIGGLWTVHRETCDDWIPFERYLNPTRPLDELLRAGPAQLARGPRFLLDAYASKLRRHKVAVSLSTERTAKYFVDGAWREQQHPLSVMHFGASFVVAERFSAIRVGNAGATRERS